MQQATQTSNRRNSAAPAAPALPPATERAVSKDGTPIAYERQGHGYPLILIDGALCSRAMGPSASLAKSLAGHFTVITYDRRGRGDSGDTAPYAVEREIDDIEAVLNAAGGEAFVWGTSSGAMLALTAASRLPGIKKLALYEPPFIVDGTRSTTETDWARIRGAMAAGRRSDAVRFFLKSVGMPGALIVLIKLSPIWPKLKAVAHTLPYDGAITAGDQLGKPLAPGRWASLTLPTLVMDGGKSPAWMRNGNRALAEALPNARYLTLAGQNHVLKAAAHAPALITFFGEQN